MQEIGVMAMPSDFAYRDVYAKGKPRHDRYDRFSIRHPNMDRGKRAKIFAPFDALKGFCELIDSKQVGYCFKRQRNEDEQNELSRRLTILKNLTYNSRMARQNRVLITATYYVPCTDTNSEAYGIMGRYQTVTGICRNVDEVSEFLTIGGERIAFADLLTIENEEGIFQRDWESCRVG